MNELEPYDTASSVAVTSPLSEKDTCEPILSISNPSRQHISYYSNRIGLRVKDKPRRTALAMQGGSEPRLEFPGNRQPDRPVHGNVVRKSPAGAV